jgi:hypothetical protein
LKCECEAADGRLDVAEDSRHDAAMKIIDLQLR